MTTVWIGSVIGQFHGYKPGRTFILSDGSQWFQGDLTDEPEYREDPTAKLLTDPGTGRTYLDVEGTTAIVRVFRAAGHARPNAQAS
jgi:hypothetical protein